MFRTHKTRPGFLQVQHTAKTHPRYITIPEAQPMNTKLSLSDILTPEQINTINTNQSLSFHMVGDTGGINGTQTQESVAYSMEAQFPGPSFLYHLGDVIYYNGESQSYEAQFYEPYKFYPAVIFAIPGNHDGDTHTYPHDPIDREPSLFGFFQNFCTPVSSPISTYRDSMAQPYVYWTLECPFATIIGLYGNVDGTLDRHPQGVQESWLIKQLKAVDQSKCLLLAVHQPPYSLDGSHGGYPTIHDAIDRACVSAGVYPHAIFSGHVHNYQRFTRTLPIGHTPYVVAGAGGYAVTEAQLHKMQRNGHTPHPCPITTSDKQVDLRGYNERAAGFLHISVDSTKLTITYHDVSLDGKPTLQPFDRVVLDWTKRLIISEMSPGTSGAV